MDFLESVGGLSRISFVAAAVGRNIMHFLWRGKHLSHFYPASFYCLSSHLPCMHLLNCGSLAPATNLMFRYSSAFPQISIRTSVCLSSLTVKVFVSACFSLFASAPCLRICILAFLGVLGKKAQAGRPRWVRLCLRPKAIKQSSLLETRAVSTDS